MQAMIERERNTHGDLEAEVNVWAANLVEVKRRRDGYQEMFVAEVMTLYEVKAKLEALR